jgi:hypothetical protein
MKRLRLLSIFIIGTLLSGCSSSHILITSNKYHVPLTHGKIMAVAVIKGNNDSSRLHVERSISGDLKKLGYNAVSAFDVFGPTGLSNLSHEETYRKLCNGGIDAVIVVTLIDKSKERQFKTKKSYTYPDNYYYDRIWTYKNIQANLSDYNSGLPGTYFWEAILFNLSTLEAECTIQSRSFTSIAYNKVTEFENLLIKTMLKEKILQRQNNAWLKPF